MHLATGDRSSVLVDWMYEKHKGHLVGLFRQPEQRLLSAYYDDDDLFRAFPDYIPVCSTETMTQEMPMEAVVVSEHVESGAERV